MSRKQNVALDEFLDHQLGHLDKYGKLVDRQQILIEQGDYKGLLEILAKKEKVIARMGDPGRIKQMVEEFSPGSSSQREQIRLQFAELVTKLDFFAAREAESMVKASGVKAELAGNIFALRRGKRMLRKYSQAPQSGKARFKDVKG